MTVSGYSGTPLPRKLGLKPGQAVAFVALPTDLDHLARAEPFARLVTAAGAGGITAPPDGLDLIHAFFTEAETMRRALPPFKAAIRPAGVIWISWPKKAARIATDLTEDVIRAAALAGGLVDVKVCAVSDVWSGLKLVIPVAARPASR